MEFLSRYTMGQGDLQALTEPPAADAPVPEAWRELPALVPAERVETAVRLLQASVGAELRNTVVDEWTVVGFES
ncbi:MAG: hypothetical protein KDB60_03140 [Propionibacteriaceae bacterium]|nr:hypothetical protein [Propionibacteriaceae bacterium]